jgi:hypothetical protein
MNSETLLKNDFLAQSIQVYYELNRIFLNASCIKFHIYIHIDWKYFQTFENPNFNSKIALTKG